MFEVTFTGDKADPSRAVSWDEVDAILQGSAFSGLRTVYVRHGGRHRWSSVQGVAYLFHWLVTHMPQCHARRILVLSHPEIQSVP
jgi:hypothetical protein